MANMIDRVIPDDEQKDFVDFMYVLGSSGTRYLLRNDICLNWLQWCRENAKADDFTETSKTAHFLNRVAEMLFLENFVLILHRFAKARFRTYRMRSTFDFLEEISINRYLDYKDAHVFGNPPAENRHMLEIDFHPFYDYSPVIRNIRNVGDGVSYLNKHLSSTLFHKSEEWGGKLFKFIQLHKLEGQQLLVNPGILPEMGEFLDVLDQTIDYLDGVDPEAPFDQLERRLRTVGFEPGWGYNAERIRETMDLLRALFYEPRSIGLEEFISRIPMISKVAILSPHGWFGQENVLGKPDTGGQVIYILDQVRAMEKHLLKEFDLAGIAVKPHIIVITRLIPNAGNTSCNQHKEDIIGTEYACILRIPFHDRQGNVLQDWVSRFKIWPYLDRFTDTCENELLAEFAGRPDLIIGNYSDGNLVATLLSDRMDVIQCTIAHALEKTKYLFSDLYWNDMEGDYHFSCQFTADLLSMNKSDFIITSTYQEIAGTDTRFGQYESYLFFTMPGLYQVVSGINLFSPKFNVVPPGVDESNYFPYLEQDRRSPGRTRHWRERLFHEESGDIFGHLEDPDKPPIFTMARLDRIKNLTGLVAAFGLHPELRRYCNLILAAGTIHAEESEDTEEQKEIAKIYALIDQYGLDGHIRWLPSIPKADTGEVYRIIADQGGMFVQPALFEAFGLTVLEAMQSGIPTFGPIFGGPSEIIVNNKCGYLMNTTKPEMIADNIWDFVRQCREDGGHWKLISENGMARVREKYTWRRYSDKLFRLTKLYGFWRFAESQAGMVRLDRYCDLLYHLLLKPRAEAMEN